MEEKEMTSQEWEIEIKEQLADSDELQLLDLAQDIAIRLAADLAEAKLNVRNGSRYSERDLNGMCRRIGRMAVMVDVLQLHFRDCSEDELMFLQAIEACLLD